MGGPLSHIALGEGGTEGHAEAPPGWRTPWPDQPGPPLLPGCGHRLRALPPLCTVGGSSARVRLFVARRPSHLLPALPGGLDRESPARLRGQAEAASPMQTQEAAPWQSEAPTQHAARSGSGGEEGWPRCWALPCSRPSRWAPPDGRLLTGSISCPCRPWAGRGDCGASGQAFRCVALSQVAQLSGSRPGAPGPRPRPLLTRRSQDKPALAEAAPHDAEPCHGHRARPGTVRWG